MGGFAASVGTPRRRLLLYSRSGFGFRHRAAAGIGLLAAKARNTASKVCKSPSLDDVLLRSQGGERSWVNRIERRGCPGYLSPEEYEQKAITTTKDV